MNALLIVDLQNDFVPGGALPAPHGDHLAPIINKVMDSFPLILAIKDWHPINHVSFAVNHSGKKIGDVIKVEGLDQILWPVHCVQNTPGSEFVPDLRKDRIEKVFYKGNDPDVDDYSGFFDNAKKRDTGLEKYLRDQGIGEITIVGIATDYCVLYSALDGLGIGFEVSILREACCAINLHPGDGERALEKMKNKGAKILSVSKYL